MERSSDGIPVLPPTQPHRAYTTAETDRGLRLGVIEGAFAFATSTLSSGAILAALILAGGMGEFEFGLLAAMPFLAQLLQFPNVALMRRFQDRRKVTIAFATAGRVSLFGVAGAMLWLPREAMPVAIVVSFLSWSAFGALSAGAWLWWMRDFVPPDRFGSYFGNRAAVLLAFSAPVLLAAGLLIDWLGGLYGDAGVRLSLAILFAVAATFGLASSAVLALIPHRPPADDPKRLPLRRSLSVPFADPNYRRMLGWLLLWGFGATISVPFFAVYLLLQVGLAVSAVTALLVVGIATNVVFFRLWGALSDSHGNKPVLAVCVPVLSSALVLAAFLPEGHSPVVILLVVVIQVLIAIATAGADLTAWNLAFKLSKGPATASYLAGQSVVRALATGSGPIIGGFLAALLLTVRTDLGGPVVVASISRIEYLFLLGAASVLLSAVPLARVKEVGEGTTSELVLALRRAAASDTLVPGVRHFAMASSEAVRFIVAADARAHARMAAGRRALLSAASGRKARTNANGRRRFGP